ncbi:MAG: hypothetical protein ACLVCW_04920 [Campylobacter sp.]
MIIAKSYNRALKRFVGGFYGRMGAVVGRGGISRYNAILSFWMRLPAKFIKFLRRLEMKFVSGMLSIKFHYKI